MPSQDRDAQVKHTQGAYASGPMKLKELTALQIHTTFTFTMPSFEPNVVALAYA